MRLDEFYNPESDNFTKSEIVDLRKTKFTLEHLNKLRKVREIKEIENKEYEEFVKVMYATPAQPGM